MIKKQSMLALSILGCLSASAVNYNALITKEHSKFEETTAYLPTGEIVCSMATPLISDIYKDTNFTQSQSDCSEIYRNEDGQEKLNSVEDRTEELTGVFVLNDCKSILDDNHSRGNDIYTINEGGEEFDVRCDMTTDGGGWTLVASMADDSNHYWTWNNRDVLHNGNIEGSVTDISKDYQNKAWSVVSGSEILLTDLSNSKYLIYNSILSNEPLKDEYQSANTASTEYTASKISGNWWFQSACDSGLGYMSTAAPDSDTNGWAEGSKGFVFRSTNNNGCNYDDTFGGIMSATSSQQAVERGYNNTASFYHKNFDNDAMTIWIR